MRETTEKSRRSMGGTVRLLGIAGAGALAVIAGVTLYAIPGQAVSSDGIGTGSQTQTQTKGQAQILAQAQSQTLAASSAKADRTSQHSEVAQQTAPPVSMQLGGASSIDETYQDWKVACALQGDGKRCAMSQSQSQKNGQRVLVIELATAAGQTTGNAASGNTVSGALLLPFGLALDAGVSLQIDDRPPTKPLRFQTCLPAGCVVPLSFDAPTITALKTATILKIATTAESGANTPFSISLKGFATALDRVAVLSK